MKFFNTAGPNQPDIHYTLSPLSRWNLPENLGLIEARKYFVLHTPRQTGKTTGLITLRDYLNKEGNYNAIYVNIEAAQVARENVQRGIYRTGVWTEHQAHRSAYHLVSEGKKRLLCQTGVCE
jgi:hypothetical protein